MKRFFKGCVMALAVTLLGFFSFSAQATPTGTTTFLFNGNCVDCAEKAGTDSYAVTATLVMQGDDVQLGQKKTNPDDFVSFSYGGSNLLDAYEITSQDLTHFSSILGQVVDIRKDLGNGTFLFFRFDEATWSKDADGNWIGDFIGPWSTGIDNYDLDYGTAGTWQRVDTAYDVPEPATALLLGAALVGLGLTRRRNI